MVGCAAYGCKSHGSRKEPGITFHRFPKDPQRRHCWITNMKFADWVPSNNDRICLKHFEERFFIRQNRRCVCNICNSKWSKKGLVVLLRSQSHQPQ